MKDSFVLHVTQYNAVGDMLSLEQKGRLLDCLFIYAKGDTVDVNDDPVLAMAWAFFRQQFDIDASKYEEIKKKRQEAGKKGATVTNSIRWGSSAKSANVGKCRQMSAKSAVNVNVNDNENVNDILINENNNIVNIAKNPQADVSATHKKKEQKIEDCRKRQEAFRAEVETFADEYDAEMLEQFFSYWSEPNKSQTKMRYEQQPTWELKRRLATWARNNDKYAKKKHYGTSTEYSGYIAPELRAAQERREQEERLAVRIRQLAEEDGGGW